jgi:Fe-S-cluster containining protein
MRGSVELVSALLPAERSSRVEPAALAPGPDARPGSVEALRREVADGIAYLHTRLGATTGRSLEAASFLYALIELLVERDLLGIDQLDARKAVVAQRLARRYAEKDAGVAVQESPHDKYTPPLEPVIDCASRVALCKAACCKMVFPLSRQDVEERVVRWDLARPFVIAKRADGYCQHLDDVHRCTIHAQRPLPCRVYDCRQDPRIWEDFEKRIVNPKIADPDWPRNLTPEEMNPGGAA